MSTRCTTSNFRAWSCLAVFVLIPAGAAALESGSGVDPQSGLRFWFVRDEGMSLRLAQILPDQTRGFFLARGFSAAQADRIALSCVFQTDFRNIATGDAPLAYDLREWVVHYRGESRRMKLRADWAREWQEAGLAPGPRTAFEWALYPTAQIYQAGDYNWGIATFDLPPGARFDLELVWTRAGTRYRHLIRDMHCVEDRHMEPGETAE